jgi:hypothetical protein
LRPEAVAGLRGVAHGKLVVESGRVAGEIIHLVLALAS